MNFIVIICINDFICNITIKVCFLMESIQINTSNAGSISFKICCDLSDTLILS